MFVLFVNSISPILKKKKINKKMQIYVVGYLAEGWKIYAVLDDI